jgi:hypothetical protein
MKYEVIARVPSMFGGLTDHWTSFGTYEWKPHASAKMDEIEARGGVAMIVSPEEAKKVLDRA